MSQKTSEYSVVEKIKKDEPSSYKHKNEEGASEDLEFFVIKKKVDTLPLSSMSMQDAGSSYIGSYRNGSTNNDNFEAFTSNKHSSSNQSYASDKQNVLSNYEKNLHTKYPGYF